MNTFIGTVFRECGKYWKIIDFNSFEGIYRVVHCTKSGKEFKSQRKCVMAVIDNIPWGENKYPATSDGKVFKEDNPDTLKAKAKKRFEFLKGEVLEYDKSHSRIHAYQREMEKIVEQYGDMD